jgi:hypothetical protein
MLVPEDYIPTTVIILFLYLHSFIILMMEAVCTSETLGYLNETSRHYIPGSCHLQNNISSFYLSFKFTTLSVNLNVIYVLHLVC